MLTAAVILSLLIGWMGGGRLSRWEEARIHWLLLPIAALFIQHIAVSWIPWPKTGSGFWGPALLLLSYLMLGLFLLRNRRRTRTALCAGAGLLCNLVVIAANGWRMPVSTQAALRLSSQGLEALSSGAIPMYALAGPETKLLFLGDIFYLPIPLLRGFASVGDFCLAAGVFFCFMAMMKPTRLPIWLRNG